MEDGDHDVEDVAGLEHEEQELLVVLAKFPEKYQKFLKKNQKQCDINLSKKVKWFKSPFRANPGGSKLSFKSVLLSWCKHLQQNV